MFLIHLILSCIVHCAFSDRHLPRHYNDYSNIFKVNIEFLFDFLFVCFLTSFLNLITVFGFVVGVPEP